MSRSTDENRKAFRIYQEHAIDELHLMRFHALDLGRSVEERQKMENAFDSVREHIRNLTKLLPPDPHVPE